MEQSNIDLTIQLVNQEEKQLFIRLGYEVFEQKRYALPVTPNDAENEGKRWFNKKLSVLKEKICSDKKVQKYIANGGLIEPLVVAIGDIVVGIFTGISPVTLTSIILKIGVKNFCNYKLQD